MATVCGVCGASTDAYLCTGDTRDLARDLLRVPGALTQLEITYAGGDVRAGVATGRHPAGPAPLPWNEAAARLIADLERHVRSGTLIDNRDVPVAVLAVRRAKHVDVIRRHPSSPTYAKQLHRILARVDRVIGRRGTLWQYGVCSCGHELHDDPAATQVACPQCNTLHDATKLREVQWAAAAGSLVTRAEAAQWLAIRYDRDPRDVEKLRRNIDVWVCRGRVPVRPGELLRFGDVDDQYRSGQAMIAKKAERARQARAAQGRVSA